LKQGIFIKAVFWARMKSRGLGNMESGNGIVEKKGVFMQSKVKQLNFQTPIKMYRIGEIVLHTPFSRQTIHNYTTMGLIHEAQWTEGGHRLYDETVFERLSQILDLKKTKTLFEIKQLLNQEDNNKPKPYSSKSSMAG
jgi:hypothetical protein